MIPYAKQNVTSEDIENVENVLRSDYLTQGPKVKEFEKKFADYVGAKYAIAVSNGTAALHLGAVSLSVKPGDKVITTPITFAASANCIRYVGGKVIFCDIDPETYLLDLNKVEAVLKTERGIVGIIPVDFAGYPVNLEKYKSLADKYNIWIMEDACHAPGAYFVDSNMNNVRCGNGSYADLSVFSFHPVKHIATGEGGMITTNNKELYARLKMLRTHGITKDRELLKENHGGWYYEMQELGYNYRLSDIHAALGISQLKRANANLEKRKKIAKRYDDAFKDNPKIKKPTKPVASCKLQVTNTGHAYHLYIIQVENRKEVYEYLRENNVYAQVHYIPIHLQPFYKKRGWKKGDFPVAEKYYDRCLSLPMYPTLSVKEQEYVIEKVLEILKCLV